MEKKSGTIAKPKLEELECEQLIQLLGDAIIRVESLSTLIECPSVLRRYFCRFDFLKENHCRTQAAPRRAAEGAKAEKAKSDRTARRTGDSQR